MEVSDVECAKYYITCVITAVYYEVPSVSKLDLVYYVLQWNLQ